MPPATLVSRAPCAEDVVLVRAFARIASPRFLEVVRSMSAPSRCAALVERGWTGVTIDASATSDLDDDVWAHGTVHALLVDSGEADAAVLASVAAASHRPWLVLVRSSTAVSSGSTPDEALVPLLEAGYRAGLFDGTSQYLVEPDHAATLLPLVDHPAGPNDDFVPAEQHALSARVHELENTIESLALARDTAMRELVQWRARAVESWSDAASSARRRGGSGGDAEYEAVADELDAMRATLSWRVTRPLRAVRSTAKLPRSPRT